MMRLDLDGLGAASREALMSEWREVVGRPPPKHLSKPLMVQILCHAYQHSQVLLKPNCRIEGHTNKDSLMHACAGMEPNQGQHCRRYRDHPPSDCPEAHPQYRPQLE